MERHKRVLKTYLQNHKGNYLIDLENGKIEAKKMEIQKSRKEIDKKFNEFMQNKNNELDDNEIENIDLLLIKDKKLKQKPHRNRLKDLKKNEEFN